MILGIPPPSLVPLLNGLGEGEGPILHHFFLTLATTVPSTHVSGPASATHTEAPTSMLLRLRLQGVDSCLLCVRQGGEGRRREDES